MSHLSINDWPMSSSVRTAVSRLLDSNDPRASRLLGKLDSRALHAIVEELERTIQRDAWDRKTQASRKAWLDKFEKALDHLLILADEGPCPMVDWGFPVRDNVLMAAFNSITERLGIEIPRDKDTQAYFAKMLSIERAADQLQWSLADSLSHYREKVRMDCDGEDQCLKKPNDEKSDRAWFIVNLHTHGIFSQSDIALIASLIFDDEAIDDRLVRRLTRHR